MRTGAVLRDRRPTDLWSGRPWTSRILRFAIVAGPIASSFATAWALSSLVTVPSTVAGAVARWVVIAAASTVVLFATDRLARRLSPLAMLLDLTLTFPDQAPSRFRLALRNGSTRQLHVRIEEARRGVVGNTPAEAAERVLELVAALSIHDRITRGHSERVRAYTRMIGEEIGLSDRELDHIQWAGLLHDVGKLLVPTSILNKPGALTEHEYAVICKHPEYGRGIVAPLIPWLGESARAVWEHHERWDGGGYPAGLAGLDISLAARIVSVADVFDVMTSTRSYKKPISPADARAELANCAGGQFDPAVVRAFLSISIGRLRRKMGAVSWLAQAPLFPTSVFASAAGGSAASVAATLAATLAVGGAATLGTGVGDDTSVRATIATRGGNVVVVEPEGFTAELGPSDLIIVTSTVVRPTTTLDDGFVPLPTPTPTITTTTAPAASTPPASTPPIGPPAPTVPATTSDPRVTSPEVTLPPSTVTPPTVTLPPVTLPIVTLPIVTLPPLTLPPLTLPIVTLPIVTLPPLPPITLPTLPFPFSILP